MIAVDREEERKEIIRRYRKLLRKAKPFLKDDDAKLIKKAFNTSVEAHKEMRRKSGEPYIYHPLAVAQICVEEIGLGTTSIVAALLHDVVEDTDIELDEIEEQFGPKVAKIIDGLTKISGVFDHGSSQQAENFRKMLLTLSEDVRVILVKLADRLHNMRTLGSMPRHKQLKIISETIYLYAPLAHRLGLYAIKSELEDLWLKYSEPEVYQGIVSKIAENKGSRTRFIKNFMSPIMDEVIKTGLSFEVKGRPKSIHSVWNKMKKQDIPFEEVFDLFAVRIIVDTHKDLEKAACWQVYSIVTDFYQPNPDRLRDWVSTPRANGYESLHTTVMSRTGKWVEVQIRTKRMDEIAEKGYAAHWKYKDGMVSPQESGLELWVEKVREMLEGNDTNAIEFVDDFRSNLFNEEVFVFTPKGDLKILPSGSTSLDFAFDIHTEIGAKCLGAKVNNRLVPLNYKLQNGDQIEILTSSKQKPNEDWLRFVVTSKAKSKIKDTLKEAKRQAVLDGKEVVRRKLKQMKIPFDGDVANQLRAYFEEKTVTDFYYKVGKGLIDPSRIKNFKDFKIEKQKSTRVKTKNFEYSDDFTKMKPSEADILLIGDDMDVLDYKFGKCCSPIPGDDVFGFVTVNEGIKIHRTTCPNAPKLLSNHGNRIVKAKWQSEQQNAFLAGLRIIGTDRVGLMRDVTDIISSELKVNMRSISIDTETGIFDGQIRLYINNTNHLDELIAKLEMVQGVMRVTRFESVEEKGES